MTSDMITKHKTDCVKVYFRLLNNFSHRLLSKILHNLDWSDFSLAYWAELLILQHILKA